MSDSSDVEFPSDVEEAAQMALSTITPEKSKERYEFAYKQFENWCQEKNLRHINEKVLLAYFELKKSLKASTLWTLYSMLRSQLALKNNIDIKKYINLVAFLKRKSEGYQPRKSNVFSKENFSKYLLEADDRVHLMGKVAMVIGIAGACRKSELTFLLFENVIDEKSYFRVTIPNTKTKIVREFVITQGNVDGINFVDLVRKYIKLRPPKVTHNRFFIKYSNGKCGVQPVGINTIGKLPQVIAKAIGLPNPHLFTGHCFRRSSATLLADSGADILKLKRHGGWKSSTVAEGYVQESIENKKRIAGNILGETSGVYQIAASANTSNATSLSSGINLTNCTNCVVNIYK